MFTYRYSERVRTNPTRLRIIELAKESLLETPSFDLYLHFNILLHVRHSSGIEESFGRVLRYPMKCAQRADLFFPMSLAFFFRALVKALRAGSLKEACTTAVCRVCPAIFRSSPTLKTVENVGFNAIVLNSPFKLLNSTTDADVCARV